VGESNNGGWLARYRSSRDRDPLAPVEMQIARSRLRDGAEYEREVSGGARLRGLRRSRFWQLAALLRGNEPLAIQRPERAGIVT